MTMGGVLSIGGSFAQGLLDWVVVAGGLATRVGLVSTDPPLRIKPLPDGRRPDFVVGGAVAASDGTGDLGLSEDIGLLSLRGLGWRSGEAVLDFSEGWGRVTLVPSVQVIVSGAQSSSSSSISAQLFCP